MARDKDEELVRRLADLLDEKSLTEIELNTGRITVRVARQAAAASVPAAALAPLARPAAADAGGAAEVPVAAKGTAPIDASHPGAVTSPMVGTAYLTPEPDAPPYVKTGDTVQQGQTLLLIEAMKTFNEIRAPKAGTVTQILIATGTPVEFGDVLMVIE